MARRRYDAREITIKLELGLLKDFGETALAITRNLIFGSPVGNPDLWQFPERAPPGYVGGHFRRNWIVSIGGFNETEIEGEDKAGAATFANAKQEVRRYQNRRKIGPNLVIQNNVPYANRLAQGHSTQAEAGWVDDEIAAGLKLPGGTEDLP